MSFEPTISVFFLNIIIVLIRDLFIIDHLVYGTCSHQARTPHTLHLIVESTNIKDDHSLYTHPNTKTRSL